MTSRDTPASASRNPADSTPSTDEGYDAGLVLVDLDQPVKEYIESADMSVDDLSYRLEDIIRCHSRYRHGDEDTRINRLASELHAMRAVSNAEDAHTLAHLAIHELYPSIDRLMRQCGYTVSGIYDVTINLTPRKRVVHCTAVIAVI